MNSCWSAEVRTKSSVDISTTYMGLRLRNPFMAGASPLSAHLDGVPLEDAGTAPSSCTRCSRSKSPRRNRDASVAWILRRSQFAERLAGFPSGRDYPLSPDEYLEHSVESKRPFIFR